jgi:hypothetical protein
MRKTTTLAISISGAILLFACSAETGPGPTGNGSDNLTEKNTDSTDPKKAPASSASAPSAAAGPSASATGPAPTTGAPGAGDDDDDAKSPTACEAACKTKFPTGAQQSAALDDAWDKCACQPNACATQCGQTDQCSENGTAVKAGDACSQCMESASAKACDDQRDASCTGECASYESCMETCGGGSGNND